MVDLLDNPWEPHPPCADMECYLHGVSASLRAQSEFYAKHDRTIEARD